MATPAARPIQKRYTAGSCILDVSFQPSALSQWHSKPIATDLAFKLWLQMVQQCGEQTGEQTGEQSAVPTASSHGDVSPTLVAEGDRAQLQAIAQHLQQQTRQTLVTPALTAQSSLPVLPPQTLTGRPAQFPPGCLVEGPLTHLQLCDLTSVLGQYEQATQTLPVALPVPLTTQLPATSAAARQPSPDVQPPTTSKNETPKTSKDNLIPFPTARRRPSRKLWASSAAAALLAVGLTTTLLQTQKQFSSQPEVTANSADESAARPQITAARPSEEAAPSNESNNVTTSSEKLSAANPSAPSSNSTGGSRSTDETAVAGSSGIANRQRTVTAPANTTPANTTPGRSSAPSELSAPSEATQQPSPAAAAPPTVAPEAIIPTPPPSPAPMADPEGPTDTTGSIASIPRSATSPTTESLTLRREPGSGLGNETRESAEETPTEAPFSALPPQPPVEDERTSTADAGGIADDVPAEAEISAAQLPSQVERSAPAPTARRQASSQAGPEALTSDGLAEDGANSVGETTPALSAGEAETVDKVIAYFQSQWQGDQQLSGALGYRLQLSENGEVVSFAAINDEAQAYRDLLIPRDRTLSFADSEFSTREPTAPLTLRITLMPNGQVLVSKF